MDAITYVIGSGFYGSVIAERIASVLNHKVIVIEKRNHIGGNSWSTIDPQTMADIHCYGSHIFHTNDQKTWNYINQFSMFNNYKHTVVTKFQNNIYPMPINLDTINKFYKKSMTPDQAKEFLLAEINRDQINSPSNFEEKAISLIGRPLYEAFIKGYSTKQWQTDLTKLPENIITRLPVRFDHNNLYFSDIYQGIPLMGYGELFKKMVSHPNIEIRLNTDFFEMKDQIPKEALIVYTGPIDRYFEYKHGVLGWRTLDFEKEYHDINDYQGTTVINYADQFIPYTRIHEFKHYNPERTFIPNKTIIYKEYSKTAGIHDDPYYPIDTDNDKKKLICYQEEAKKQENVLFGGRLGMYKYLDMHQVIHMALHCFEKEIIPRLTLTH